MTLEVIRLGGPSPLPPLLFVHGSFAGAWIWSQHFLPFFAEEGRECVALSLRGHGGSGGHDRLDHFGLADYVEDVAAVAATLDRPPVVLGHSLGGMVAQRYCTSHPAAGQVLIASVPPGGFASLAWWMALHHPVFAWQIGLLETFGKAHVDAEALARGLFSPDFPPEAARHYLPMLQRESARAIAEVMPPQQVWRPRADFPTLVIGGDADAFISQAALHATAAHWQAQLVIQPGIPHGMMLDPNWRRTAEAIRAWLSVTGV